MAPNQQLVGAHYRVAIVGSGPAGLSAAARAQYHDAEEGLSEPSYILLEGFEAHAKTIQQYQKGMVEAHSQQVWASMAKDAT